MKNILTSAVFIFIVFFFLLGFEGGCEPDDDSLDKPKKISVSIKEVPVKEPDDTLQMMIELTLKQEAIPSKVKFDDWAAIGNEPLIDSLVLEGDWRFKDGSDSFRLIRFFESDIDWQSSPLAYTVDVHMFYDETDTPDAFLEDIGVGIETGTGQN